VDDPAIREIIERPGAAAVILRQLVGMCVAFKLNEEEEDDEDLFPALSTIITDDAELVRRVGAASPDA
jgi:hypothetical protein